MPGNTREESESTGSVVSSSRSSPLPSLGFSHSNGMAASEPAADSSFASSVVTLRGPGAAAPALASSTASSLLRHYHLLMKDLYFQDGVLEKLTLHMSTVFFISHETGGNDDVAAVVLESSSASYPLRH